MLGCLWHVIVHSSCESMKSMNFFIKFRVHPSFGVEKRYLIKSNFEWSRGVIPKISISWILEFKTSNIILLSTRLAMQVYTLWTWEWNVWSLLVGCRSLHISTTFELLMNAFKTFLECDLGRILIDWSVEVGVKDTICLRYIWETFVWDTLEIREKTFLGKKKIWVIIIWTIYIHECNGETVNLSR